MCNIFTVIYLLIYLDEKFIYEAIKPKNVFGAVIFLNLPYFIACKTLSVVQSIASIIAKSVFSFKSVHVAGGDYWFLKTGVEPPFYYYDSSFE